MAQTSEPGDLHDVDDHMSLEFNTDDFQMDEFRSEAIGARRGVPPNPSEPPRSDPITPTPDPSSPSGFGGSRLLRKGVVDKASEESPDPVVRTMSRPLPRGISHVVEFESPRKIDLQVSSPPPAFVRPPVQESHEFVRRTPTENVELSFGATLEKAMLSCRKLVAHELSAVLRPNSVKLADFDFGVFCDGLTSDLNSIIDYSSAGQAREAAADDLARKVGVAIDEQTSPVVGRLRASSAEESAANQKRGATLRTLASELDALRRIFKSGSDQIIQELDRKRDREMSARQRDVAASRGRILQLEQLKYKRAELERRIAQLKIGIDANRDSLRTLESQSQTFHEEELPSYFNGRFGIGRVLSKISDLRHHIAEQKGTQTTLLLEDVVRILAEDRNQLNSDIQSCEMATRYLSMTLESSRPSLLAAARRTPQRRPSAVDSRSSIVPPHQSLSLSPHYT
jgi:hypothetical protein